MKKITLIQNILKVPRDLSQRGISLIEGVLYLVIALAVIVGGIVFFQQAQMSRGVTETSRMLVSMQAEVRSLYKTQNTFGGESLNEALISARIIPENFVSGTGSDREIVHSFNEPVSVTGVTDYFHVTLSGLPREACVRLVSVNEVGVGLVGQDIIGFEVSGNILTKDNFPVTPVAAAAICTLNADLRIYFGKESMEASWPETPPPPPPPPAPGPFDHLPPWLRAIMIAIFGGG